MKIFFLIRSLHIGGAERQLFNLCVGMKKKNHSITIITFYNGGEIEKKLKEFNITIISINKKNKYNNIYPIFKIYKLIKEYKPDVLYSYMQTANIVSAIIKLLYKDLKIIWGVRISKMNFNNYDFFAKLVNLIEHFLSKIPNGIITNSEDAKKLFINHYKISKNKVFYIPNGIDTKIFFPIKNKKQNQYLRIKYKKNYIIGMVARLDPMKDHITFFYAINDILKKRKDIFFVCVGKGNINIKNKLINLSKNLNIYNNIAFIDSCDDMNIFYNQLNILTLTSEFGEGFSNAISEALSCNIPCVVSNVGESANIVGSDKYVFKKKDYISLSKKWEEILKIQEYDTRTRIIRKYSLDNMINKTEINLKTILNNKN